MNFERVVKRSLENNDYEAAAKYVGYIIAECPASVKHYSLKCEYLLRAHNLSEAQSFSNDMIKNSLVKRNPKIIGWRGKILIYSGNES